MNVEVSNHMQALEEEQIKALDKNLKPRKTLINKILKIITKNLIKQNSNDKENNKVRIIVKQRRKKEQNNKGKSVS